MNKKSEKFNKMKESELLKEVSNLQLSIMRQRIDIANHKTKGIHKISEMKKDIARINTLLTQRAGDKNE